MEFHSIALKIVHTLSKGHLKTNRRPCQYLTHAYNHITRAVASTDTGAQKLGKVRVSENPLLHVEGSAKQSIKCQLHTTHVGAVGWEPHGSSPTTCAGKADHGFGVCVPLALICLLKIVN